MTLDGYDGFRSCLLRQTRSGDARRERRCTLAERAVVGEARCRLIDVALSDAEQAGVVAGDRPFANPLIVTWPPVEHATEVRWDACPRHGMRNVPSTQPILSVEL